MGGAARYIRIALTLALAGVLSVAGFNAAVDPKAVWQPVHGVINRIDALEGGGRLFTSERLARGDLEGLILGTSRCLRGIDPSHPAFAGLDAFNACLSGTNMLEIARLAEFARTHNPRLRRVVIGLDFEAFTARRDTAGDFDETQLAGKTPLEVALDYLLSWDTLRRSISTLAKNIAGAPCALQNDGFVNWDLAPPAAPVRFRFDSMLRDDFLIDADNYAAYLYAPDRVTALERVITALRIDGVAVFLYVSPIHARQMEAIEDLGLGSVYERWLGDLARLADVHNIPLLDFSGYNGITTEPVPQAGSHVEMHWYWESSHFRKATGDLILDRLVLQKFTPDYPEFGRPLDPLHLPEDVTALREGHILYAKEQPREAKAVASLVRDTAPARARLRQLLGHH